MKTKGPPVIMTTHVLALSLRGKVQRLQVFSDLSFLNYNGSYRSPRLSIRIVSDFMNPRCASIQCQTLFYFGIKRCTYRYGLKPTSPAKLVQNSPQP